jgi:Tfp pilus assembly protein PilF
MRTLRVAIVVSLCACFSGQDPRDHRIRIGSEAANRAEREIASRAKVLQTAGLSDEKRATILFEMGLLRQEQAEEDQKNSVRYLRKAIEVYELALKISPNDGGTLNNVARAYAAVHDPRAETIFTELIKRTGDRNLAVYLFNYGIYLEARGEIKRASVMRKRAAEADAGDPESQLEILRLYIPRGSREALSYLRPILEKGYASSAYDYLLATLELPHVEPADREQFAISVAKSLALQSYDPAAFLSSNRGKRLSQLQEREPTAAPAGELVALHRDGDLSPEAFPWWSNPASDARRHAFIDLAARIGTWYVQHNDLERAGRYYDLAVRIPGTHAAVIQGLTQIYAATGNAKALLQLSLDAERYLAAASAPDTYAVHRELGMSLASLGVTGPPHDVGSSLYQLTQTSEIALAFNARNRSAGIDERLPIDTALIGTLETGWRSSDTPARAVAVRLVAASDLLGDHDVADAVDILRPVADQDLTIAFAAEPQLRDRFAALAMSAGMTAFALTHWPQNGAVLVATATTTTSTTTPMSSGSSTTSIGWTRYSME